jgi:hypothetical protein
MSEQKFGSATYRFSIYNRSKKLSTQQVNKIIKAISASITMSERFDINSTFQTKETWDIYIVLNYYNVSIPSKPTLLSPATAKISYNIVVNKKMRPESFFLGLSYDENLSEDKIFDSAVSDIYKSIRTEVYSMFAVFYSGIINPFKKRFLIPSNNTINKNIDYQVIVFEKGTIKIIENTNMYSNRLGVLKTKKFTDSNMIECEIVEGREKIESLINNNSGFDFVLVKK